MARLDQPLAFHAVRNNLWSLKPARRSLSPSDSSEHPADNLSPRRGVGQARGTHGWLGRVDLAAVLGWRARPCRSNLGSRARSKRCRVRAMLAAPGSLWSR